MGLFPKRDVRWSWVRRFVRFKRGADTYPRFLGGKYVMSAPFFVFDRSIGCRKRSQLVPDSVRTVAAQNSNRSENSPTLPPKRRSRSWSRASLLVNVNSQDKAGNIWYLGEYVTNYENGKIVDHGGSFEAGVDGAQPGIAMPANPEPGLSYRQEYYKGEAEDNAAVITVGEEQVQVPFGYFNKDVLMTRDLVPTEPKVQELKFYAPNVGPLLSVHTDGAGGLAELVTYSQAG